jgi:hypothetical protein
MPAAVRHVQGAVMWWRAFLVTGSICIASAGCMHDPAFVGDGFQPINVNDGVVRTVRSQKPDTEPAKPTPPKSLLDMPPERPGDPNLTHLCASIRAVVNGKVILNEEVRQACYAQLRDLGVQPVSATERSRKQKEILLKALEFLVEWELLNQDIELRSKSPQMKKFLEKMTEAADKEFDRTLKSLKGNLGLKTDEEIQEWFQQQGLSLEGMRKQKRKQMISEEYMRQMVIDKVDRVGHQEIVEYYLSHPEEFQVTESVQWQDLMIDAGQYESRKEARQVAEQLVKRLQAKEDFLKLAELYDPRGFQFTHGDGEGQKRGLIRPAEVEANLFKLRDGQAAVVEMPNGFHVIRMVKHTMPGRMSLDDKLQSQIRDKLRNEVGLREQRQFMNRLKSKATIEYSSIVP